MTTRRSFFRAFAGAVATAAAVDPERLLWTPGKKLISIPNRRLQRFLVTEDLIWLGETGMFTVEPAFPPQSCFSMADVHGSIRKGAIITVAGFYTDRLFTIVK
jgi:hypothetical protein